MKFVIKICLALTIFYVLLYRLRVRSDLGGGEEPGHRNVIKVKNKTLTLLGDKIILIKNSYMHI